jgi:hypothetical protein
MKTWIPDERFLPYRTWKEVDALPKDKTLIVLPTAAIEQHGHHLPLATDTLLNNYLLGHALPVDRIGPPPGLGRCAQRRRLLLGPDVEISLIEV